MTGSCPAPGLWPSRDISRPRFGPPMARMGRRILDGRIRLVGQEHPFPVPPDWRARDRSLLWRFNLHYFEWIGDLAAVDG